MQDLENLLILNHSISGTIGATTITVAQMPSHTHYISRNKDLNDANENEGPSGYHDTVGNYTSNAWNYLSSPTGSSNSHTHSMTNVSTTSSNILPPYYSLAYIIRIV